uniref:Polycomb group ring finger 3 n=1 Tax=Ornithorhynchus anatinus TaxID=9258 RepID=A0A6I8NAC5_ORNAN
MLRVRRPRLAASAPLGHFRLFVLNSGWLFFPPFGGGPPRERNPPSAPVAARTPRAGPREALSRISCPGGHGSHDRTMQDIVYKLVPGLQEAEMKKQREFYHKLGMEVPGDIKGETCSAKQHLDSHRNGETKADDTSNKDASEEKQEEDNDYHRSDEQVSICLECNSSKLRGLKRKWIRCSAQATVLHLKKFIAKKLNLSSFNELDILCNEEILGKDHTLKFVVVTRWRFKKAPLLLHYRPKMDLL